MSFDGHVLCQRMVIGPCALTMVGATTVATPATAAPPRNLRRVAVESCLFLAISLTLPWIVYFLNISSGLIPVHGPTFRSDQATYNRTRCHDRKQHRAAVWGIVTPVASALDMPLLSE